MNKANQEQGADRASNKIHHSLPKGSLVALITPFHEDCSIDYPRFRQLIDWHIRQGTSGIVVAGTTGEACTLSFDEHERLLAEAAEHAAKRIHVVAGVGANSTAEAVTLARLAEWAGVDSLLSVVPYYNKPSQEGLVRHFEAQADATALPLILYSVAGRTVVDFSIETIHRLSNHPSIAGIKDASGDMLRAQSIAATVPAGFSLYSGDDFTLFPYLALGGQGVISVTANIAPRDVADLCAAMDRGDLQAARSINSRLYPLTTALFAETNPIAVKYAASIIGCGPQPLRLPLAPLATNLRGLLDAAVTGAGVSTAELYAGTPSKMSAA